MCTSDDKKCLFGSILNSSEMHSRPCGHELQSRVASNKECLSENFSRKFNLMLKPNPSFSRSQPETTCYTLEHCYYTTIVALAATLPEATLKEPLPKIDIEFMEKICK